MCPDPALSENNAQQFDIRSAPSVDKNGNPVPPTALSDTSNNPDDPNYICPTGMGWFPGYAINLETGERLNIIFSEDSWLVGDNGRDMKWNPSPRMWDFTDPLNLKAIFGGKHYIYVFAHTKGKFSFYGQFDYSYDVPAYDAGRRLREAIPITSLFKRDFIYSSCMWVNIPMALEDQEWMSNDVTIRILVAKPYFRYFSTDLQDTLYMPDSSTYILPDDIKYNRYYPAYSFNTEGIATTANNMEKAKNDLDLINVVPNPYYGYASYETDQLDNRIKIVNLPQKCTVTIYNMSGTLIRQFTKDETKTSIDWDLKNHAGIPIASGIYLIHVKANGVGERVIKWFGSLRAPDFNAF
jgi:hypothetical protein